MVPECAETSSIVNLTRALFSQEGAGGGWHKALVVGGGGDQWGENAMPMHFPFKGQTENNVHKYHSIPQMIAGP